MVQSVVDYKFRKKSTLSFYGYNHKKRFFEIIGALDIPISTLEKIEKNKIFRPLPSKLLQLMQEISDTLRNKAISQLYLDAQLMKIVYFNIYLKIIFYIPNLKLLQLN